jgi:formamidopyrimidine-DNA glycosylase
LTDGSTVGLRFGMTGRLIVDESPVIDRLEYAPHRDDPDWDRFAIRFAGDGSLRLQDPRRLGGVELDPDEDRLGPDVWTADATVVGAALGRSTTPLKARLMDQARLAGLGNLLTDEILWRAGVAPVRSADSLDDEEVVRLTDMIHAVLDELDARGGSHTGDLHEERSRDGHCPVDGSPLTREQVGGRTTYWCKAHQQ